MLSKPILQRDVDLRSLTTFGIEARARYFIQITEIAQLAQLDQLPELAGLPRLVLGGGSNVILTDDFPGVVLHIALRGRRCLSNDQQFTLVEAAAGEPWHEFVLWTLECGWGGLENLSLIPGSVGAAPIQNIGAYGVEVKDRLHSLRWYEFASGAVHTMTAAQCEFAYRDSIFKQARRDQGIILDVTFALPKQWHANLGYGDVAKALQHVAHPLPGQISQAICAIRQSKLPDPAVQGNVGSFFKNPLVSAAARISLQQKFPGLVSYPQADGNFKLAAGWLIEQAGWKGRTAGAVGVYEKQALVLVNLGGATGKEVIQLAQAIQRDVQRLFSVELEVEPVLV